MLPLARCLLFSFLVALVAIATFRGSFRSSHIKSDFGTVCIEQSPSAEFTSETSRFSKHLRPKKGGDMNPDGVKADQSSRMEEWTAPTPINWSALGFIKIPKTGSTTLSHWILQPLAMNYQLPPLRRVVNCKAHPQENPFCKDDCIPGHGPFDTQGLKARVILGHTFYNKKRLDEALVSPVLYFAVFRRPEDILRSMYTMAFNQYRDEPKRWVNGGDAFCQDLTKDDHDATEWLNNCPAASEARGLIVDYLTAFNQTKDASDPLRSGEILPLLQERFDESLVLFARIAGLEMKEMVYLREHSYGAKIKQQTLANWKVARSDELVQRLTKERAIYYIAKRKFEDEVIKWFGSGEALQRETEQFQSLQHSFEKCVRDLVGPNRYQGYNKALKNGTISPLPADRQCNNPHLTMILHLKELCTIDWGTSLRKDTHYM